MKKIYLLIMLTFLILLSACENTNNNTTTTVVEESTSTEKSTENKEEISVKDKLKEINYFLSSDIWGDGFCNISWFIYDGTNKTGNTLDIDFLIDELDKSMETKKEYDIYINELDNEKYSDIKSIWEKLSPEIDKLYNKLKENPPVAKDESYVFDTGLYKQYSEAFKKNIDRLEE